MLTCDAVLDRLYDEDVRRALAGGTSLPADVAGHSQECTACRAVLDDAAHDLRDLAERLIEAAPARVAARARTRLARQYPEAPLHDWNRGLTWAAVGSAVTMSFAVQFPVLAGLAGPVSWGVAGAAMAFAASAVTEALAFDRR